MKAITIWIILSTMVVAFIGTSCCPCRHLTTTAKDSVKVEVYTRIEYVRDTVFREIPLISETITTNDTTSHLTNYYAQSYARINPDGTLYHSLATRPQKEPIAINRPVEYRDSIVYRDRIVKESTAVGKPLTWWEQTQIKAFWVLLATFAFIYRKEILNTLRRLI